MLTGGWPREGDQYDARVVGGASSTIINLVGYLDILIVDMPASETFKLNILGPAGVEYHISPNTLTGDQTIIFDPHVPLVGKMTFKLVGVSADGVAKLRPVGSFK